MIKYITKAKEKSCKILKVSFVKQNHLTPSGFNEFPKIKKSSTIMVMVAKPYLVKFTEMKLAAGKVIQHKLFLKKIFFFWRQSYYATQAVLEPLDSRNNLVLAS